ncbi:MAG: zinc-ribbon domain-containing protein [Planctomycetes bacterium]|nr:zinc-ribbon domain-containing protein [Planctomycetota bacterium]
MPIQVTCPGCHKRFQVSDKFAGKQGPCPKCKTILTVPKKEEEAVIHAPEQFGPKGKTGQAVLKPIARTERQFSPVMMGIVAGATLMLFALAWLVGRNFREEGPPMILLAAGALALAPPIVYGGYSVLRDDELEPHRGQSLWIRVGIVGLVYAATWAIASIWLKTFVLDLEQFESFHLAFVVPAMFAVGGFASYAALDLETASAGMHYGFYLLVTVLLRLTMGMGVI